MRKVKFALWIIVLGFVGLIIGQNWEFFKTENSLLINLFFTQYETPFLANAVFFVGFFLAGVLISYFFSLFKHYKDAKTIKALKAKESSLIDAVASLEKQLANQAAAAEEVQAAVFEEQNEQTVAEMK
jgi:uncharacterized integral membrane protein